jgi:catechol 2,3-dioxygenase-like lactoylglutathione lyase family enzyme
LNHAIHLIHLHSKRDYSTVYKLTESEYYSPILFYTYGFSMEESIMIDHIGIDVSDYQLSKEFYSTALSPLGYSVLMEFGEVAGLGADDKPDLWISRGKATKPLVHIAFQCRTREQVDKFYTAALKAGGKDNGPPGIRKDYSPTYYAAYVFDPDGHNIEAVFHANE